jgi:hypothetical protein
MDLKEAKQLSILKWELIVANDGKMMHRFRFPKEIQELKALCGFCHYQCERKDVFSICDGCKFMEANNASCVDDYSENDIYTTWRMRTTKENAEAVLNLIKNIEV